MYVFYYVCAGEGQRVLSRSVGDSNTLCGNILLLCVEVKCVNQIKSNRIKSNQMKSGRMDVQRVRTLKHLRYLYVLRLWSRGVNSSRTGRAAARLARGRREVLRLGGVT